MQLTAVPNVGYLFGSWSGGASGTSNPISVTMSGNKSVTANFRASVVPVAPAGTLSSWDNTFSWSGHTDCEPVSAEVQKADGRRCGYTWYTAEGGLHGGHGLRGRVEGWRAWRGDYKWRIQDYGAVWVGARDGLHGFTVPAACYSLTSDNPAGGQRHDQCPGDELQWGLHGGDGGATDGGSERGLRLWELERRRRAGASNPVSVTMSGNKSVTANCERRLHCDAPAGTLSSWNNQVQLDE